MLEDVTVHHPGARVCRDDADVDLLARVNQHGVPQERLVDLGMQLDRTHCGHMQWLASALAIVRWLHRHALLACPARYVLCLW